MNFSVSVAKYVKKWNDMKNYVVTGFDEEYWHLWGASWLVSLRELAKFDPEHIVIVGFNLSASTKAKIQETGAMLFPGLSSGDIRSDTMRAITDFAKKEAAIFAYWDADVYFQEDISEVFKIAKDDLVVSSNRSPGFLAGPSYQWMCVQDVLNIMSFMNDKGSLHECLATHFSKFITKIDNTWNSTDIPHLKDVDGKLTYKGKVQKVVHPTGQIKRTLNNRNIFFWERHKELYQSVDRKKTVCRKLMPKSGLNSNINNNK
jgi:hypothetical protein